MTDTARDAKLVQYLSEAYGKEKELETALVAHISMTTRKPYKKRLQDHLKETRGHAREVERRIKKLGGSPSLAAQAAAPAAQVVGRAKALAEGPLDMIRGGTGENEEMLKNAQKEYWNEHDEIAKYSAIETLAEAVGDKETAQLARSIRRDEERMAKFLASQITSLTKAVVTEEIPAKERRTSSRRSSSRRRSSGSSSSTKSSSSRKRAGSSSSSGSRTRAASSRAKSSSSRAKSSSSRAKSSSSRAKSSTSRTRAKSSSSRAKSSGTRKRPTSSRSRSRS
jgi:ferritin-like metal-binding protein YciE